MSIPRSLSHEAHHLLDPYIADNIGSDGISTLNYFKNILKKNYYTLNTLLDNSINLNQIFQNMASINKYSCIFYKMSA